MASSRHDRKFWEGACREVARGASVGDVARRLGVRARTLSWWAWKLRSDARKPKRKPKSKLNFLPVITATSGSREASVAGASATVELEAGGVRVRVSGEDVEYVAALVKALRGSC